MIRLTTNVEMDESRQGELLPALSKLAAKNTGKPERYVMAIAENGAVMISGQPGAAAFVEVRGIGGLGGDVNRNLTTAICSLLKESLGVPPERVYVNFFDVPAGDWGWNGETFG